MIKIDEIDLSEILNYYLQGNTELEDKIMEEIKKKEILMTRENMKERLENIWDLVGDILNETPKEQILVSRERLEEIKQLADNEPIIN